MTSVVTIVEWLWQTPSIAVAAVCFGMFVYVLASFFSSPEPGPNPFEKDSKQKPKPLVVNSSDRDKILKQGELLCNNNISCTN